MPDLLVEILVWTVFGQVVALIGGVLLLWRENVARRISIYLVGFAAGALLGTVFLDFFPEIIEHLIEGEAGTGIFLFPLVGIVGFFVLERFLIWHHHHHTHSQQSECQHEGHHHYKWLVIVGDSIHNFVDGMVIAGSFLVNPALGVLVAIAVFCHEVPQEIGDFGVLLHSGIKRGKVLLWNLLSALVAIAGALIAFFYGSLFEGLGISIVALAVGMFLYISIVDLIPEMYRRTRSGLILLVFLLIGIGFIWLVTVGFPVHGH